MDGLKFFELSDNYYCSFDKNKQFVLVSNSFKSIGYTSDELLGKQFLEIVHPEDITITSNLLTKLLNTSDSIQVTNRILHKNGGAKPIIWKIKYVSTEKLFYAVGTMHLSQNQQKDTEINEINFQQYVENSKDMIYRMSLLTGKYEYVSPASTGIMGYSPQEFYEKPLLIKEIIHPDWIDYFKIEWEKLTQGKLSSIYEYQIINKSGEIKWLNQRNTLITDNNNTPVAIEGVVTDITDRKETELNLQRSSNILRASQKIAKLGGWEYNIATTELFWTKQTFRIHDLDPDTYNPTLDKALNFYTKDSKPIIDNAFKNAIASGLGYDLEVKIISAKNRLVHIRTTCEVVKTKGKPTKLVGTLQDITEQINTHSAFQESEEKFKNLADTAQVAISIMETDQEKGILYVNKHWEKLTEYTANDAKNLDPLDIIHPEFNTLVLSRAQKRKAGEKVPNTYDIKLLTKTGKVKWVTLSATIINYEGKVASLTTAIDITVQKNAQEELIAAKKKANKNAEMVLNSQALANICSYSTNLNVNEINKSAWECSPEFYKIFGIDETYPHTIEGWANFIHPDHRDELVAYHEQVVKNKRTFDHEYKIIRINDGAERWVHGTGELVYDEQGNPIRMHGAIQDITDAKNSENKIIKVNNELKIHNLRLESLTNILTKSFENQAELLDYTLHQAIKLTESKIGYVYFYSQEKKQFTLNTWSGEVMKECAVVDPQTLYDLDATGCWGEAVRQKKPFIINDYSKPNKYKKGTPDGHVTLKKFLTVPVIVDDEIKAVIGVANKITDYNNTDIQQLTLMMGAVWKVVERTENQIELIKAKEKAEESDRLKSAFLANMSHEIRTPLNAVLGFSKLLTQPNVEANEKKIFANYIKINGESLAKIIDDIIDISKLEVKQLKIKNISFDLRVLFNELYNYYSKFILEKKEKQLNLHMVLPDNLPDSLFIISDEHRLKQILNNLITNAIKYSERGDITFGFYIKKTVVQFFVQDTGYGISNDKIAAIFDRFTQFNPNYVSKEEGTGLGLSISKNLVELLGGELKVNSEEKKGSKFYFSIPLKLAKPIQAVDNQNKVFTPKSNLSEIRILIADDEDSNYVLTKRILKSTQVVIDWAQNGKHAVEMATNTNYDLVIMDVKMPEMNGIEATKLIKEYNKKIPVVMQTAFAMKDIEYEAKKAGCDGFIIKPIELNDFIRIVNKHIK